jgi:hypothetical protein
MGVYETIYSISRFCKRWKALTWKKLLKTLLKTTFWIGNLTYLDKNSKEKELIFIEYGSSGIYVKKDKHPVTSQFEMRLNEIVSEYQEDIKEL